jgi:hypothetical protein
MAAAGPNRPVKKEGALSALIQVVVVGAAVGGGLFAYAKIQGEEKRVMELAVKAKESTEGDDAPALLKAQKLFAEIGDEAKLEGNDAILSSLTELEPALLRVWHQGSRAKKQLRSSRVARCAPPSARRRGVHPARRRQGRRRQRVMMELADKGIRHAKILHAISSRSSPRVRPGGRRRAQEGQKLSTQLVRLPISEGDALLAVGNIPSAANAYLKAKKLNPDHMRARTALTLVAAVSRQGKPDLLIKELDRLMEEMTTNPNYGATPPPRVKAFIDTPRARVYLVNNSNALAMARPPPRPTPPRPPRSPQGRARELGKPDEAKAFDRRSRSPASCRSASQRSTCSRNRQDRQGIVPAEDHRSEPGNGMSYVGLARAGAGEPAKALASADRRSRSSATHMTSRCSPRRAP